MPEEVGEEDFRCFTCGVSKFVRRDQAERDDAAGERESEVEDGEEKEGKWDPQHPSQTPEVQWRDGKGVGGGWTCEANSDCSFLENGEERGW